MLELELQPNVARLVVSTKTMNPTGFKYGDFRVWGDLERSRYFKLRVEERGDEAFELLGCGACDDSGAAEAKCT